MAESAATLPNDGQLIEALRTSLDEVFAMLSASVDRPSLVPAPMPTNAAAAELGIASPGTLEATVRFSGAAEGLVSVLCTEEGATNVARGMLMRDSEDELAADEVRDALCECVNMVAGALKTKVLDPGATFRLGLPEFGAHVPRGQETRRCMLAYRINDGLLATELWLER